MGRLGLLSLVVLAGPWARADEPAPVAKVVKQDPPAELREPIRALLSDQAVTLADDKGAIWATFWFRSKVPSKAAPEQVRNGLTYREIDLTTFIAAVQFTQPWTDFRKQRVPAGVYTLRIAVQPMTGDHDGTAPTRDFCLLAPAARDEKPDLMDFKELIELSASILGASHPSVLLLFPGDRPRDEPHLVAKPGGVWVLNVKQVIRATGGVTTLGFGLTVQGHAKLD